MAAKKPASVSLRDLADDIEHWALLVSQIGLPGTDDPTKVLIKATEGLMALVDVLRGYAVAGFSIEG